MYEQEYTLERSQEDEPFVGIATLPVDTTHYEDESVAQNTAYVYRLRAVNSAGNSPYSFWSIVTISPNILNNTTTTTNSNTVVISQPTQYISGALKYSWEENPEKVKIIVNEIPPVNSIELIRIYADDLPHNLIIRSYSSAFDLPADLIENFDAKYFFAIDAESFEGTVNLNLKIPLNELEHSYLVSLAISEEEGLWEILQMEMTAQDDSFAYYSARIPAEARYAVAFDKTGNEKYLALGIILILIVIIVAIAIKIMKPKRI